MLILPVSTDRRLTHTPWANYTIIAVNVVAFFLTGGSTDWYEPEAQYMLWPDHPEWFQFFSYAFLHAGWMHIIGNMLFLWVFGNNLEDRLGPVGYLAFYLAGGVIAAVGHALTESSPVLGASGAVCAVTGAYLALFPRSVVTLAWLFFFVQFFQVSSIWLIGFQFSFDVFMQFTGQSGVAYLAHISGYLFGFAVGMVLLWTRVLPREPFDFLSLVDRWHRRRQMRSVTRQASPWQGDVGKGKGKSQVDAERPDSPQQRRIMELRSQVGSALREHGGAEAVELYEDLLAIDATQCLPRQTQLDLANRAMASERYHMAATAYERFIETFRGDSDLSQIRLILALIYARYLENRSRARQLLDLAEPDLSDEQQRETARQLRKTIEGE